jgi:hypothetical protein
MCRVRERWGKKVKVKSESFSESSLNGVAFKHFSLVKAPNSLKRWKVLIFSVNDVEKQM